MSTDLRTQFLNYMTLQRFSQETKRHYVSAVNGLAKFYNQSPDTLTNDQIQEYFRHLLEDRELSWGHATTIFRVFSVSTGMFANGMKLSSIFPPDPGLKNCPRSSALKK